MHRSWAAAWLIPVVLACAWAAVAADEAASRPVGALTPATAYSNDFRDEEVGPEWSRRTTDVTPAGKRRFLGRFGNVGVALVVKDLPAHGYVRLAFDLFVIGTWDGNRTDIGPDRWRLAVDRDRTLVDTTFGAGPLKDEVGAPRRGQSYPDDYPADNLVVASAAEIDALGYTWQFLHQPPDLPAPDEVYRVTLVFPHAAANLYLECSASGLQELDDESWGLDNVTVEVLPGPPNKDADPKQRDAWWKDLMGDDPVKANAAKWALVGVGEKVVPFVAERLKTTAKRPAMAPEREAHIRKLIADLDHDHWPTRERATEDLKKIATEAAPLLKETLATTKSAEVRWRVEAILEILKEGPPAEPLDARTSRVRRILEVIGTDEAKRLLATLPAPPKPPPPGPNVVPLPLPFWNGLWQER